MNKVVTSRQEIINAGKELASKQGLASISIRQVAAMCGVSVGSIYNYFTDKAELVTALIEAVWKDAFHRSGDCSSFQSFPACVIWLFDCIRTGTKEYPAFFTTHTVGLDRKDKEEGRQIMGQYFAHMKSGLMLALRADGEVRADIFNESFTESMFIDFVFRNIVGELMQKEQSCDVLLEVIKRIIYKGTSAK